MLFRYILMLTLALMLAAPGFARAEFSVSYTYNYLWGTNFTNDDLTPLMNDPKDSWSLADMTTLQVMVMDTSNTANVTLVVNGTTSYTLYSTGAWTSPTRGFAQGTKYNLVNDFGIGTNDTFQIFVGDKAIISPSAKMWLAPAEYTGEFLIGFNDNGSWSAGDGDMNEPLLYASKHTPIPGAIWLLGSGLVGLVGLRRKFV